MRISYTTDLHGNTRKYERILSLARAERAAMVINGGDMLPKDGDLFKQDEFIRDYLEDHFAEYESAGIWYLCYLGNDDLRIFDEVFDATCKQFTHIINLAQKKVKVNGYDFIGMNWVVDYPFRCKDRCRMDTRDYRIQKQFGKGVLSTPTGWKELEDWPEYASSLPTLADELSMLPRPDDMSKALYVIHMPRAGLGLDVITNGEHVGSEAVRNFLEKEQPFLSLHGHIHESPEITGVWRAMCGRTQCVQPGQHSDELVYVLIDLNTIRFEHVQITL